jgi:hypothetical protein
MDSLVEIRAKFPQYADIPDDKLVDSLHTKFYSDMPKAEFEAKLIAKKPQTAEDLYAGQTESLLNPATNERNIPAVLAQSLGKGFANVGDVIVGAPENYKRLYEYAKGKIQGQDVEAPRGATPITNLLVKHGIFAPEREPNTPILKAADFAAQVAAPGTITKIGSIPSYAARQAENIGQGLLGGAALETVKSAGITNPLAEQAVAFGAMAAPGGVYSMRNTPSTVVNQAMRNLSPEQLTQAQALVDRSYKFGNPITGAEAISQIAGGSKLPSIQRYVENVPRGEAANIMGEFMAGRPQANEAVMSNALRQISPNAPSSATPGRLQTAGENLISGAEKSLSQNVKPLYEKAGSVNVYPAPDYLMNVQPTNILSNPKIADAVKAVRSTSEYGVKGAPTNSFETLIAAKKYLDDQYAGQMTATTGLKKGAAGITASAVNQLSNYLKETSPEYAKGAKIYQTAQEQQIQPLKQGLTGAIAETTGIPEKMIGQQSEILMPKNPKATSPNDIKRTIELLRRKDPTVAADWTRQELQGVFDQAARDKITGGNQFGGAKFAADITGNKTQKANLQALIETSSGKDSWKGFENMLETMQAQGQRVPAGSSTTFNNLLTQEMEAGGKGAFAKYLTSLPTMAREGIQAWELGKNTEMLAKMLIDPKSVEKLNELAKTKPDSRKARNIVNSVVGGYVGQKPELAPEENK